MATSKWPIVTGLVLATLLAACASGTAPAGKLGRVPLTLASAEGNSVTLAELWRERAAVVLVFWSTGCPCVRRYQERVDGLLDRYPPDQVRVVAISSNAGESFAEVLRVAKERAVRVPILRDETGQVAQAVGARTTPTAVVLDGQGEVRFLGWIDNEREPGDPERQPWLDLAIQGILDRRSFAARTPLFGCAITRSLLGASPPSHCCHEQHQPRTSP